MKQESIVFVTHISYLDGAIEHTKLASKTYADFNVVITLSPTQIFRNIIDLRHVDFSKYGPLVDFGIIENEWKMELFAPYFENCKSVKFLMYHGSGSMNAISVTRVFNRYLRSLRPKYIHFDSYINRQIFQLPFLYANRKKIILNVHDPKSHSGEEERIRTLLEGRLYKWCAKFITFSDFSKQQLTVQLKPTKKVINSFLLPFDFYKNYLKPQTGGDRKPSRISFVGRISKYKGIDLFIEAINIVHEKLPETEFVIAGKSFGGYEPDFDRIVNSERVTLVLDHLSNEEMVHIITDSQLIVCPYRDASQSGVVMTALALNRPVLVTEAGGLKEYVGEGRNGLVSKIDSEDLASKIIDFCEKNLYEKMSNAMQSADYLEKIQVDYVSLLDEIYS